MDDPRESMAKRFQISDNNNTVYLFIFWFILVFIFLYTRMILLHYMQVYLMKYLFIFLQSSDIK